VTRLIGTRMYCAAVTAAGLGLLALVVPSFDPTPIGRSPLTFVLLSLGVIFAETLPVKIPRRGEEEEITLSTSFVMALLLACGLGPALLTQGLACVIQDVITRKPWWRAAFNLAQYSLSLAAAYGVLWLLDDTAHLGSSHPFSGSQLPDILLCSVAFFIVNTVLVGTAISLYQGVSIRRYFRMDLMFVITTAGVLLLLAPIVIATTAYSPLLIPLFAAPTLAIHRALWAGARSAHAARHDSLTGLPNRPAFHEAVRHAIKDGQESAVVLLMDLDRFKDVNDTLGHHYGDLLLEQVAGRLRDQLRPTDQVARLGGDEFAILSEGSGREAAMAIARRIADALRPPFELDQIVMDVQASIGIAVYPEDGADGETLLQRADVAMYRAKETRVDIAPYDERHDHHSPSKLALSADLRSAIAEKEIVAWYQPELELCSGEIFAVEALVRWPHARLGMLPPAAFLEMAEHTNMIKPLTQRVLQTALEQLRQWSDLGVDVVMAVNVSTAVLIDERFTESVMDALDQAGVSPHRLKLEVTESTLMADPMVARTVLQDLHGAGVEISIDDFGTGYSSLAYLADLPVSEVKIDRSFVRRMAEGSKEAIIVNSTIDLAHHLGLRAVAEGVEDLDLLLPLAERGCEAAQGYAICRPKTADELTPWLLSARERGRAEEMTAA
jgi:diguanylate cyclase (GGDEF)-like protein